MAYRPCQYLVIQPGKAVRKGDAYRCNVVVPLPDLPASMTKTYDWPRTARVFHDPVARSYVGKEDCAECPLYSPASA